MRNIYFWRGKAMLDMDKVNDEIDKMLEKSSLMMAA
jgi:hypothetical protein